MNIEKLKEEITREISQEKPCEKPYQCSKKISKKVQKVLKELDEKHNHSLAIELYNRNKDNLDKIALYYRGTKITYEKMFETAYQYAKSLKEMGFKKGSEVPICITNTPEFIYLFLATSFIGAKANIIGQWFDKEYLTEILNKTNSNTIFIDDISYDSIKESIKNSNIDNIVCLSLTNSLRKDKSSTPINPYEEFDNLFNPITDKFDQVKNDYPNTVLNEQEFIKKGESYQGNVIENVSLNDTCSITYTSGTTSKGRPKGVIQSNRSYITLSRFKEKDVSGMPTMKDMSVLAHIPTYTHMELSCAISDTLYCNCVLALEPFYQKEFFPYALVINKPNFVPASTGFWGYLCKLLTFDEEWQNINMPYLMIPTVTGEGCSIGEEKFFNQTSRKHKFGTAKLPFPLAPVTFSIGGGTTESSGIFVTLFKNLQEKKLNHLIKKETLGLTPHRFAEVEVLDEYGNYCEVNQPGLLVAISPCEMNGYTNEELNKNTHVTDATGRQWLSLGTYSYKDTTGRIKMKGRMHSYSKLSNGEILPHYQIEDIILKDTKNIMSCTIVETNNKELVCHIELQPFKQKSTKAIYESMMKRLDKFLPEEIKANFYFRIRDNEESFPLDPSGKRSISTLTELGIDNKTLSYNEFNSQFIKEKKPKVKTLTKSRK